MNDSIDALLPVSMNRANTCCFTGHRNLHNDGERLAQLTELAVRTLLCAGYRYFLCGGALGFDMLAEETVLRAAETCPDAHLVLALPCRDQTADWGENSLEEIRAYRRIVSLADAAVYTSDFRTQNCMAVRNQYMVDHASFCVAYYRGTIRSGTGQTVRMAQRAGLTLLNLYDALKPGGSLEFPADLPAVE